ncbi:MAG: glutamine--tRNA ligase, partial [Betaproteobacteria bacterium]|nr:glutamine--tRNA ligase [Betaproteobacteria bacterium]
PDPGSDEDFRAHLNPESQRVIADAKLEAALATAVPGASFQFERLGYFVADRIEHRAGRAVFQRTVGLKQAAR